jgi:mycofactocin precursor
MESTDAKVAVIGGVADPAPRAAEGSAAKAPVVEDEVAAEDLIEEVSIDGMCGVY